MPVPNDMDRQWAWDELRQFVDLIDLHQDKLESVDFNGLPSQSDMTKKAHVVERILDGVVPGWRTNFRSQRVLAGEWGTHRESSTRAMVELERADELAEKLGHNAPGLRASSMHPLVWAAASRLWRGHHFRQAVSAAAEALIAQVKSLTGRVDVADTPLWQEAFSERPPVAGKPRLRWPGDPSDRDVKNMNDGLRQFAPGVQMLIRNPSAHGTKQIGEQEALEQLAVLSLLARWVDQCEVLPAPTD